MSDDIELMMIKLKELKGHKWERTDGRSRVHYYAICSIYGYRVEYVPASVANAKNLILTQKGFQTKYLPNEWVPEYGKNATFYNNCEGVRMNDALE